MQLSSLISRLSLVALSIGLATAQENVPGPPSPSQPYFTGKSIDDLNASEVLKLVRYSYTLMDQSFHGRLRVGFRDKHPFGLWLKPDHIAFQFQDPKQLVVLDTKTPDKFLLLEGMNEAQPAPVATDRYGQTIRGTDVTYEDLSMRFLYWPNPRIIRNDDKLKGRECWLVRVSNPDGLGNYATVDAWIDKGSGGLMKMIGYNRLGRPIRKFEVLHGKKMGDIWMVDEMRIETIDPSDGKRISHTYMEILDLIE